MARTICANGPLMSWKERLQQEWLSARDPATREHLLAVYADQIAALPEDEREELFATLQDIANSGPCTQPH
jgi:hypothetical protein